MKIVTVSAAKTNLSSLLKSIEQDNESVIIQRGNNPIARIIPYKKSYNSNRIGLLKGKIKIAEDFDELPDDIAISLGMRG